MHITHSSLLTLFRKYTFTQACSHPTSSVPLPVKHNLILLVRIPPPLSALQTQKKRLFFLSPTHTLALPIPFSLPHPSFLCQCKVEQEQRSHSFIFYPSSIWWLALASLSCMREKEAFFVVSFSAGFVCPSREGGGLGAGGREPALDKETRDKERKKQDTALSACHRTRAEEKGVTAGQGGTGEEGRRCHGSAVLLPFLPSRGENQ